MTRTRSTIRRAAVVLALAGLLAAVPAGVAAAKPASVNVKLTMDFKIQPSPGKVKAGKVTFVVKNTASSPHELVVIKTNLKAGKLPVVGGAASEKGKVGETGDLDGGKTKKLTLNLKKGHYALICNLPGHYQSGMYADFTVS